MAQGISSQIDQVLAEAWAARNLTPAPVIDDAAFLRRATLDLAGRIPTIEEMEAFEKGSDRGSCIDRLLESDAFPESWSSVWTAVLNGYGNAFETDREALRLWLRDQLRNGQSYDRIATRLMTTTGPSTREGAVNFLARYPDAEAVRISRMFLGVRLDCARCHDHPFDRWKQSDFTAMERFFDATRREGGEGNPTLVDTIGDGQPLFLTGAQPQTSRWRQELALFVTHTKAFRRTFSNRIWYQLIGRGIVNPPDDFSEKNPPVIPELLELLAGEAKNSGWNVRELVRGICGSLAYQRSSRSTSQTGLNDARERFAVSSVKPMTPEQLYHSLRTVFGGASIEGGRHEFVEQLVDGQLDEDYSQTWKYRETVQQRMKQLALDLSPPARSQEQLFLRILSRLPTEHERQLCRNASPEELTFALMNGNEFYFNH